MKASELRAAAEAILFASGDPLELSRIACALEIDEENTALILENLSAELDERSSGICLVKMEDKYQLCTRDQFADDIRRVLDIKRNAPLSQAAFEVLAVIAYNQPITKSYIEQVRGVDCSSVLSTLCQRGLVEERGRLELPGRPLLYGTTPDFLRCFCMGSLNDLPELPDREEQPAEEQQGTQLSMITEETPSPNIPEDASEDAQSEEYLAELDDELVALSEEDYI